MPKVVPKVPNTLQGALGVPKGAGCAKGCAKEVPNTLQGALGCAKGCAKGASGNKTPKLLAPPLAYFCSLATKLPGPGYKTPKPPGSGYKTPKLPGSGYKPPAEATKLQNSRAQATKHPQATKVPLAKGGGQEFWSFVA